MRACGLFGAGWEFDRTLYLRSTRMLHDGALSERRDDDLCIRRGPVGRVGNRSEKPHPSHTEGPFDCAQDKWGTQRRGLNASEAGEVVSFRYVVVKGTTETKRMGHPPYPRSDRPSSENKRVLHFARAMTGIMEGIGAIRAIDLIRLRQHGTSCGCVLCEIEKWEKLQRTLSPIVGTC